MQTSKEGLFDNTKIEVKLSEEDLNSMFKHLMNSEIKGGIGVTKDKELYCNRKEEKREDFKGLYEGRKRERS